MDSIHKATEFYRIKAKKNLYFTCDFIVQDLHYNPSSLASLYTGFFLMFDLHLHLENLYLQNNSLLGSQRSFIISWDTADRIGFFCLLCYCRQTKIKMDLMGAFCTALAFAVHLVQPILHAETQ